MSPWGVGYIAVVDLGKETVLMLYIAYLVASLVFLFVCFLIPKWNKTMKICVKETSSLNFT